MKSELVMHICWFKFMLMFSLKKRSQHPHIYTHSVDFFLGLFFLHIGVAIFRLAGPATCLPANQPCGWMARPKPNHLYFIESVISVLLCFHIKIHFIFVCIKHQDDDNDEEEKRNLIKGKKEKKCYFNLMLLIYKSLWMGKEWKSHTHTHTS